MELDCGIGEFTVAVSGADDEVEDLRSETLWVEILKIDGLGPVTVRVELVGEVT